MTNNLQKSILRSILVNQKTGTTITSKKFEKLKLWKTELQPYLDKLQQMGYIQKINKKVDINIKILKPITINTITKL